MILPTRKVLDKNYKSTAEGIRHNVERAPCGDIRPTGIAKCGPWMGRLYTCSTKYSFDPPVRFEFHMYDLQPSFQRST